MCLLSDILSMHKNMMIISQGRIPNEILSIFDRCDDGLTYSLVKGAYASTNKISDCQWTHVVTKFYTFDNLHSLSVFD